MGFRRMTMAWWCSPSSPPSRSLIPVLIVAVLRARRDRRPDEIAAWIAATVAIDLLAVMVLCRLMRLKWAAIVSASCGSRAAPSGSGAASAGWASGPNGRPRWTAG